MCPNLQKSERISKSKIFQKNFLTKFWKKLDQSQNWTILQGVIKKLHFGPKSCDFGQVLELQHKIFKISGLEFFCA
jgi:hypothetical protein